MMTILVAITTGYSISPGDRSAEIHSGVKKVCASNGFLEMSETCVRPGVAVNFAHFGFSFDVLADPQGSVNAKFKPGVDILRVVVL